jgi:hypothetical protein
VVEDETQVFEVKDRVDIRNDLLTKPVLLAAADLQPVFPVADLGDLRVNLLILQDEGTCGEIEQV